MTAHVLQDLREIEPLCSFCQRRKSEVKTLIGNGADPARYICGGCVVLFKKATSDHDHTKPRSTEETVNRPGPAPAE